MLKIREVQTYNGATILQGELRIIGMCHWHTALEACILCWATVSVYAKPLAHPAFLEPWNHAELQHGFASLSAAHPVLMTRDPHMERGREPPQWSHMDLANGCLLSGQLSNRQRASLEGAIKVVPSVLDLLLLMKRPKAALEKYLSLNNLQNTYQLNL